MAESHLGHQSLKTEPPFDGAAGSNQPVIDGDDRLARPAEMERPVDERILKLGRLLVALNLLRRRLPDVDFSPAVPDVLA
jgi:hypothetical protein